MTRPDLRVTLVQLDTAWHAPEANRATIEPQVLARRGATDLVILPETFTTGFSNAAVSGAEGPDGPTVDWMRRLARDGDAAITGSIQCRDGDAVYNRLFFATPDGRVAHYDKRHLFRMAREQEHYGAGRDRLVVEFRGWRICPLVCYDLRFPVFARNTRRGDDDALDYDLLLFVANWPAPRHEHWRLLLRARAVENLAYVAGVNRAGHDGNGHAYQGGSAAIAPTGETLLECDAAPCAVDLTLDGARLDEHRRRFPAHLDADRFIIP